MIRTHKISVSPVGAAGSATATAASKPINGRLLAVHINYTDQHANTDVTIATSGTAAPAHTLMTKSNTNTDGWFYPRTLLDDNAGADLTAVYGEYPIDDSVIVTVAQGSEVANGVIVTLLVEC